MDSAVTEEEAEEEAEETGARYEAGGPHYPLPRPSVNHNPGRSIYTPSGGCHGGGEVPAAIVSGFWLLLLLLPLLLPLLLLLLFLLLLLLLSGRVGAERRGHLLRPPRPSPGESQRRARSRGTWSLGLALGCALPSGSGWPWRSIGAASNCRSSAPQRSALLAIIRARMAVHTAAPPCPGPPVPLVPLVHLVHRVPHVPPEIAVPLACPPRRVSLATLFLLPLLLLLLLLPSSLSSSSSLLLLLLPLCGR
jgi:hypothetical protein